MSRQFLPIPHPPMVNEFLGFRELDNRYSAFYGVAFVGVGFPGDWPNQYVCTVCCDNAGSIAKRRYIQEPSRVVPDSLAVSEVVKIYGHDPGQPILRHIGFEKVE